jgi:hypothetical protein
MTTNREDVFMDMEEVEMNIQLLKVRTLTSKLLTLHTIKIALLRGGDKFHSFFTLEILFHI